nr:unnamed protein product [Callosobruchus analis]
MGRERNLNKSYLLGYELTLHHSAIVNHLVPSICSCALYIALISTDTGVCFCHLQNDDTVWASLSLFIMYLPAICSYVIVISNWELWPEFQGCGRDNLIWFWVKTVQHLFFPAWSMWRFAERIFWSIEGVRAKIDESVQEAISIVTSPRSIELYIFLQSYLHSLPQVLLQLHILMKHSEGMHKQTENVQIASMIFNLARVAVTTTYYQRFKSQKLVGKDYPWYKRDKIHSRESSLKQTSILPENQVVLRRSNLSENRSVIEKRNTSQLEESFDLEPCIFAERRRSSDIYLEPAISGDGSKRNTLLETSFDDEIQTVERNLEDVDEGDGLQSNAKKRLSRQPRETSIKDGPERLLLRESTTEPDFNISRVVYIKGLADDDMAGRLVAFLWWFAFLLARVLAISTFAYFFKTAATWLIFAHFTLVLLFFSYDIRTNEVKRAKAMFFLFLGLVYIFCIIEFKIKFKKATFIYYGFFALVFIENFVMCLCWYLGEVETIENDYWFRYMFYIVVMCSITSLSAMVFYFNLNKPPKVVVPESDIRS